MVKSATTKSISRGNMIETCLLVHHSSKEELFRTSLGKSNGNDPSYNVPPTHIIKQKDEIQLKNLKRIRQLVSHHLPLRGHPHPLHRPCWRAPRRRTWGWRSARPCWRASLRKSLQQERPRILQLAWGHSSWCKIHLPTAEKVNAAAVAVLHSNGIYCLFYVQYFDGFPQPHMQNVKSLRISDRLTMPIRVRVQFDTNSQERPFQ